MLAVFNKPTSFSGGEQYWYTFRAYKLTTLFTRRQDGQLRYHPAGLSRVNGDGPCLALKWLTSTPHRSHNYEPFDIQIWRG